MRDVVLFRRMGHSPEVHREMEAAARHFPVAELRTHLKNGDRVVGRYSVLPYYTEVEADLGVIGARLVNTRVQHTWIANFDWYQDLRDFTPPSWTEDEFPFVDADEAPFVVKGATNSRKWNWDTMMFAATKAKAVSIGAALRQDSLIGDQRLIYRKYVPLKHTERSIAGVPFAHEFRFFCWKSRLLAWGYYWSPAEVVDLEPPAEAIRFAEEVAARVAGSAKAAFFVLDVAETEDQGWTLIEVNDGQQSGLSEVDPEVLYGNLAIAMREDPI